MRRDDSLRERIRESVAAGPVADPGPLHWLHVHRSWDQERNETYLLFEPGRRHPSVIVKVSSSRETGLQLRAEYERLARLARAGRNGFRDSIPEPVDFFEVDGRYVLVEEAVAGVPLPSLLHRCRRSSFLGGVLDSVTRWLLAYHRAAGIEEASAASFREHWMPYLARFRDRFDLSRDAARWLDHVELTLADPTLGPLPLVETHGDLCPANVLVDGRTARVIDWEIEWPRQFPHADLLHFVHSLLVDLTDDRREYLDRLEATLFGVGAAARAFSACMDRYHKDLPVARDLIDVLPTLFWVEGALVKSDIFGATCGDTEPCAYVVIDGSRCLNLERFAWRRRSR